MSFHEFNPPFAAILQYQASIIEKKNMTISCRGALRQALLKTINLNFFQHLNPSIRESESIVESSLRSAREREIEKALLFGGKSLSLAEASQTSCSQFRSAGRKTADRRTL